jgi:broad specificity phosphatase PhoE
MIQLVVIRHAQTAWNVGEGSADRFRGTVNLPLSEVGVGQAEATSAHLADWPLAAVYTSPLQRASHMGHLIARPHGVTSQSLDELSSINYGAWAGRTHTEVRSAWPDLYRIWQSDPFSISIPGGEDTQLVLQRVRGVVDRIRRCHKPGDRVVLVTHQAITKTLTCELLGLPGSAYWRVRHDLCGLNLFLLDPRRPAARVQCLNDVRHLSRRPPVGTGGGCSVLLVRHGQTAWNAPAGTTGLRRGAERFRGQTDVPLSEQGHLQARSLAVQLEGEPVSAVYASPLRRTQQTAQPLADALGVAIGVLDGLLDLDYGELSGLRHADAADRYPELYATWERSPGRVTFPGGESLAAVRIRALDALDWVAARHPGETVVLVGHQIVNKVVACALLGADNDSIWGVEQDTGALNAFHQTRRGWQILAVNLGVHGSLPLKAR